jgi:O-antigen/teichoic acid export membrane protein
LKRLGFIVVKNAIANIVRGGASAVVAILLPYFLTKELDHDRFPAWVLMLQIASYANYLNFGIQTAISRFLAQAVERDDARAQDELVSTALAMLFGAAVVAFLAFSVTIIFLPTLLPEAPRYLIGEIRLGTSALALSAVLLLPLALYSGILVGLHRNELPAMAIGSTRILGAVFVIVAARRTHSLVTLAVWIAVWNLIGGIVPYFFSKRLLPGLHVAARNITSAKAKELSKYCAGLTVFSVGMLLVSGLDVTIVGYNAFHEAGYYAIATSLITFVSGMSASIFSAFMTPMAVLQERKEYARISGLVIRTARVSTYVTLSFFIMTFLFGEPLLRRWIGQDYAIPALAILQILAAAQAVRLLGSSYSVALIATGQQKYGTGTALVEGGCNFILSVVAVRWMGATGVAVGTLVGAVIGITMLIWYVMPRVKSIQVQGREFTKEAVLRPVICLSPLLITISLRPAPSYYFIICTVAAFISATLILRFGKLKSAASHATISPSEIML